MLPEATSKLRLSDERGEAASDGQGSSQTPMLDTVKRRNRKRPKSLFWEESNDEVMFGNHSTHGERARFHGCCCYISIAFIPLLSPGGGAFSCWLKVRGGVFICSY